MTSVLLKDVTPQRKRRSKKSCWYRNRLPLLCTAFGFFWCSLAVVMILLYTRMVQNDIPFVTGKPPEISPCYLFFCPFGATCQVNETTRQPMCVCEQRCSHVFAPVCGSDGATYSNLCMMDRASCIHNKPIQLASKGPCDPCEGVICESPTVCHVNGDRTPECRCSFVCPSDIKLVCGSDGRTYSNLCLLSKQACKSRRDIRKLHDGKCSPENNPCNRVQCGPGEECAINREGTPVCECPPRCEPVLRHVCGNDSTTYDNECELKRRSCLEKVHVTVKHPGPCGTDSVCHGHYCYYGAVCVDDNGKPICKCPQCSEEYKPVCGDNGITYENECKLREENCQREENVQVVEQGTCVYDGCKQQNCDFYAVCEVKRGQPTCVCPSHCVKTIDYVCGNDGITYDNECELRVESCKRKKFLTIASTGTCGSTEKPNDDECNCNELGSYGPTCDPHSLQCTCKPGVGGKRCDRCRIGYWGIHLIGERNQTGCIPCDCNEHGSERDDCDQMTGRCLCRPAYLGMKCDMCPNHKVMGPDGCVDENQLNSCDDLVCGYGSVCILEYGRPTCRCEFHCDTDSHVTQIVCGTDGQNYGSECQLAQFACRLRKLVAVAYFGPCKGAPPTPVTTSSPVTKSRKTTRHIEGSEDTYPPDHTNTNNNNNSGGRESTEESEPTCSGSNIDDLCLSDDDCCPNHSRCRNGLCNCYEGYIPSLDKTSCYEVQTKPAEEVGGTAEINACTINPCMVGTCILDDRLGYRCACPLGKAGVKCDREMKFRVPSFGGHSYIELPGIKGASQDMSIEIIFTSLNKDGIILFNSRYKNGSGDFVSLAMKDGFVEFRYDLGGGPAILRSRTPVEPIKSHTVIARIVKQDGLLIVDQENAVSGSSPSTHSSLDLNDPLLLGLIPGASKETVDKVGVNVGLVGCVQTLKAGSRNDVFTYSLNLTDNHDIWSGMDVTECGSNPCKSMPCKNGATCLVMDALIYKCRCQRGYRGRLCEEILDPCASHPCQHGGTCVSVASSNRVFCQCPKGREGLNCEIKSKPDRFVPQFTGDSYMMMALEEKLSTALTITVWFKSLKPDGVILFVTQHPNGSGDFIALNLDDKNLVFTFHLGSGLARIESKKHIHLDKWHSVTISREGRQGEMSIDRHPPVYGEASSIDFGGPSSKLNIDNRPLYLGGFSEREDLPERAGITSGFTGAIQRVIINGRTIDGLMGSALSVRNISVYNGTPCNVNPCLNGGVCVPILNESDCRCPPTYMGERCELMYTHVDRDQAVQFDGMTYLSYPNEISHNRRRQQSNSFSVKFRTTANDGILLLQHGGTSVSNDYLSIAVSQGYAQLSYNLGKEDPRYPFIITSNVKVNDGNWHTVNVTRQQQEGSLQVDNDPPVNGSSKDDAQQLNTDGLLWVGGLHSHPYGLPVMQNFYGCIGEVMVNGQQLHLIEDKNGHSSTVTFCTE